MPTSIDEIGSGIYRISIFVPEIASPAGFTFNHFLILGDEPLLFHCGRRKMFPLVSEAVARIIPVERLRWLTFGHFESDECGSMNEWLAAAPHAQLAHGMVGCRVSVADVADRPPHVLADGEVVDIGGKRAMSTRRMSRMAGMQASFSRRRRRRCSAEICLPISAILRRSRRATSSHRRSPPKIFSTRRVSDRQRGRPSASWLNSNRIFWPSCTVHHFPVMERLR